MRSANPLSYLMRALLLALVGFGFVVSAGAAFAHDGRHDGRVAAEPSTHHAHDQQGQAAQKASSDEAANTDADANPCPRNQSPDHSSNNCCNIACHAALAAAPMDPVGTLPPHGARIVGLTDLLVGRSNGRTERPPRLV
ncbi:hypothetical protein [Reyranella sp.]|uniref:hypothetical protein n=1 Tax=Reyranella sp. TaxID=1929291 RepID=UPI0025D57B17|nr:hypothetical protein [Reyranella sp.]